MNALTFSLGGIGLSNFEVPEEFDFGTKLNIVVHEYVDETGYPIIKTQSQGAFPLPTSWKGTLYYSDALERALQLDQLCRSQNLITWVYGPLQWQVIVREFKATVRHQHHVDYNIELVVVQAQNGAITGADNTVPFDIGTQNFFQQATDGLSNMQTADPTLPDSLTQSMQTALGSVTNAFPLQNQPVSSLLSIQSLISTATANLSTYNTGLQSTAVSEDDLAKLNAGLYAHQGFSLLNRNLSQLTGSGPYSQSVPNFVGDLYVAASTYYPNSDPSVVAPLLASANGLIDNYTDEPITLNLPPIFSA